MLVLSYLKSCEHETITGGTVRVGTDKSDVEGGKIARAKVPCNGGNMKLAAAGQRQRRIVVPPAERADLSRRSTRCPGDPDSQAARRRRPHAGHRAAGPARRALRGRDRRDSVNGGFYDLAKAKAKPLRPRRRLQRDARQPQDDVQGGRQGQDRQDTPVVSRLLRFPPG